MKASNYRLTLLSLLIVLIAACTSTYKQESEASFIARQRTLAVSQQQNNELATALSHWQVILLLDPNNEEATQQQQHLSATLNKQAEDAYTAGLRAFRAGRQRSAKAHFLSALVANPRHKGARQKLQHIQKTKITLSQKRKSTSEQEYELARSAPALKPVSDEQHSQLKGLQDLFKKQEFVTLINRANNLKNPQNARAIEALLLDAHIQASQKYIAQNRLEDASKHYEQALILHGKSKEKSDAVASLSTSLATAYHQSGRRLLTTDINEGIAQLKASLKYNSSNQQVERLLKQSLMLQKRLAKINQGN